MEEREEEKDEVEREVGGGVIILSIFYLVSMKDKLKMDQMRTSGLFSVSPAALIESSTTTLADNDFEDLDLIKGELATKELEEKEVLGEEKLEKEPGEGKEKDSNIEDKPKKKKNRVEKEAVVVVEKLVIGKPAEQGEENKEEESGETGKY